MHDDTLLKSNYYKLREDKEREIREDAVGTTYPSNQTSLLRGSNKVIKQMRQVS
jgi:hypothetical protein